MTTTQAIFQDIDLLGKSTLLIAIRQKFTHVSCTATGRSIATDGSRCGKMGKMNLNPDFEIVKLITHKDGSETIKTNHGIFITFLNL